MPVHEVQSLNGRPIHGEKIEIPRAPASNNPRAQNDPDIVGQYQHPNLDADCYSCPRTRALPNFQTLLGRRQCPLVEMAV